MLKDAHYNHTCHFHASPQRPRQSTIAGYNTKYVGYTGVVRVSTIFSHHSKKVRLNQDRKLTLLEVNYIKVTLYFLVVSFENHMKILRTIDHWENPISFHIYSTLVNHMVAVKLKHKSFTGSLNTCYSKQIRYMTRAVTPSVSQNDYFPWCSDAELKAASESAVGFELNWGPCAILASIKRGTVRASDN